MNKKAQYLIEGITKDIIAYLMEDHGMSMPEAIVLFHNSETFEKLSDEATGLYIESSAYVYEILKSEIKMGKIN
ncbi:hypothetical protein [Dysgonomonas sp. HGC4]|uniref:hypothetical protein n=1 Tax=Dysgonomonas sp. HGC4 TaxID=1658009 RepID=UPI0006801376|nr:hypothetical protein [Dysgonomonas sp. HGC4]MBD8347742.1 hypothetical protein [Dysgonomonas sp. HGC4]